jgi:tRNA (guanine37-N1)-methyltransferase
LHTENGWIGLKKRLRELLSETLPPEDLIQVYNSYDIVGDIAIIRLPEKARRRCVVIAEAVMNVHKNVKTVLAQVGAVQGDFRLRTLEHVAGEDRTSTVHRESGCAFSVDVEKCYFSPRLHNERMRIAKQVRSKEVVINMFAGVGCFSILIAKHSDAAKVYSIDINPVALQYMSENVRVNGVYGRVIPILGDAKDVIEKRLRHTADRVLMPLPEKALGYLPYALLAMKKHGGVIHYYDFEHAMKNENPVQKVTHKVVAKLESFNISFEIALGRIVRSTGPNWYQVVLDIMPNPQ